VRGTRYAKESDLSKLADFGKVALRNPFQIKIPEPRKLRRR
jgi:hypothetical protein